MKNTLNITSSHLQNNLFAPSISLDNYEDYRYGFNGKEKDDELKGEGNSLNFKYRMHDPRIGRFFAIDPLRAKYPFYTPYAFSGNRVVDAVELEGKEPISFNVNAWIEQQGNAMIQQAPEIFKQKLITFKEVSIENIKAFGDNLSNYGLYVTGLGYVLTIVPITTPAGVFLVAEGEVAMTTGAVITISVAVYQKDYEEAGVGFLLELLTRGLSNKVTLLREAGKIDEASERILKATITGNGKVAEELKDTYLEQKKEVEPNIQKLDDIQFDSNKAQQHGNYLTVQDLYSKKYFNVVRNSNGSYRHYESPTQSEGGCSPKGEDNFVRGTSSGDEPHYYNGSTQKSSKEK